MREYRLELAAAHGAAWSIFSEAGRRFTAARPGLIVDGC